MTFISVLPPWLKKRTEERQEERLRQSERRQMVRRTRTEKFRWKERDKDGLTLIFS